MTENRECYITNSLVDLMPHIKTKHLEPHEYLIYEQLLARSIVRRYEAGEFLPYKIYQLAIATILNCRPEELAAWVMLL